MNTQVTNLAKTNLTQCPKFIGIYSLFFQNYTICKAGDKLTSEQARILKLFDHKQAKFKLNIISVWSREDGSFKMLREDFDEENGGEDEENEDENMDDDAEIVE